jgi:hypothetical protein
MTDQFTEAGIADAADAIRNASCETPTYPFSVFDRNEAEANIREWCKWAARAAITAYLAAAKAGERAPEDLTWFWEIVDRAGLANVASDERKALSELVAMAAKSGERADGAKRSVEYEAVRIAAERQISLSQNGADDDGIALKTFHTIATPKTVLAALCEGGGGELAEFKRRIEIRLNAQLCEMEEGYDDSIVGFNEAWSIVRGLLAEMIDAAPSAPIAEGWSQAARDVLSERQRQISAEGWTPEHDDEHTDGDLALAAACYAIMAKQSDKSRTRIMGERTHDGVPFLVKYWPWSMSWWKPTDRRRDLIKSCALALAEIERLDRLPAPPTTGDQK